MSDTPYKPRLPHRELPSTKNAQRALDGRIYTGTVDDDIDRLCARVLGTPDGQRLLGYLRGLTLNVAFDDSVQTNALLHKEGQRWLVGMLVQRCAKGNEP
jgi:hypothetical protein